MPKYNIDNDVFFIPYMEVFSCRNCTRYIGTASPFVNFDDGRKVRFVSTALQQCVVCSSCMQIHELYLEMHKN